jgi:hypothetical protein
LNFIEKFAETALATLTASRSVIYNLNMLFAQHIIVSVRRNSNRGCLVSFAEFTNLLRIVVVDEYTADITRMISVIMSA